MSIEGVNVTKEDTLLLEKILRFFIEQADAQLLRSPHVTELQKDREDIFSLYNKLFFRDTPYEGHQKCFKCKEATRDIVESPWCRECRGD